MKRTLGCLGILLFLMISPALAQEKFDSATESRLIKALECKASKKEFLEFFYALIRDKYADIKKEEKSYNHFLIDYTLPRKIQAHGKEAQRIAIDDYSVFLVLPGQQPKNVAEALGLERATKTSDLWMRPAGNGKTINAAGVDDNNAALLGCDYTAAK